MSFYIISPGAGYIHPVETCIVRYIRNVFTKGASKLLFCNLEIKKMMTYCFYCVNKTSQKSIKRNNRNKETVVQVEQVYIYEDNQLQSLYD